MATPSSPSPEPDPYHVLFIEYSRAIPTYHRISGSVYVPEGDRFRFLRFKVRCGKVPDEHAVGYIPIKHARTFGRPCRTCFPRSRRCPSC